MNKRTYNALLRRSIKKSNARKLADTDLTLGELLKFSEKQLEKYLPANELRAVYYQLRGTLPPDVLERREYRKTIRQVFRNSGFTKVNSVSDIEFTFKGRPGDIDDVYVYENVIILLEYTCAASSNISDHVLKKKVLFDYIHNNKVDFIEFFKDKFPSSKEVLGEKYQSSQFELRILYCSKNNVSDEHKAHLPNVIFFDFSILQYFLSISNIIRSSSRFELFNYLRIEYSNIGERMLKGSTGGTDDFHGYILPEEHSSFKTGYKLVTFYIDAGSLITRAYVLRKEGWNNYDGLYQRMIIKSKIDKMREYLHEEKRVFINNIIVTLPTNKIALKDRDGKVIKLKDLHQKMPVQIQIQEGFNLIGLVDGQHRVYAYHEGEDKYSTKISNLRAKQNLLATGIIYPSNTSEEERLKFEAQLFLEINANQSSAKSDLKNSIRLLLDPFSTISIATATSYLLSIQGPLASYLKQNFYEKKKLPTASIVLYGLKPIVKLGGNDSLFLIWDNPRKEELKDGKDNDLLKDYREFCASKINNLLIGYKKNIPKELWTTNQKKSKFITVTSVNGLINCLRLLIENRKTGEIEYYEKRLRDIAKFDFKAFKSSQYRKLGQCLYNEFF